MWQRPCKHSTLLDNELTESWYAASDSLRDQQVDYIILGPDWVPSKQTGIILVLTESMDPSTISWSSYWKINFFIFLMGNGILPFICNRENKMECFPLFELSTQINI